MFFLCKKGGTTWVVECRIYDVLSCIENTIKRLKDHKQNNDLAGLIFITDLPSINLFFKLPLFFLLSLSLHARTLNKPPLSLLPLSIWSSLQYKGAGKARGQLREAHLNEACFMCQSSWASERNFTDNSSTPGSKCTHVSLLYTRGKASLVWPRWHISTTFFRQPILTLVVCL